MEGRFHYVASDQLIMRHNEVLFGYVHTLGQNQINRTWKIIFENKNHGWFKETDFLGSFGRYVAEKKCRTLLSGRINSIFLTRLTPGANK